MALGICLRALRLGIRLPDSLLLSYPALNLNFNDYTPSVLNALYDMVTPITVLQ
jgi:hormone-sensitive lipase